MSEYDQLTGQVKTLEREVRRLRVGLDKIATPSGGVRVSAIETSSLPDLTDYARLPGRTGGQLLKGGIGAGENLLLQSTAHATRGRVGIVDNAYTLGYLRVGSAVAPTNVTAGDFTAARALIGDDAAISTGALLTVRKGSYVPPAATNFYASKIVVTHTPNAASSGTQAGLFSSVTIDPTADAPNVGNFGLYFQVTHNTGDFIPGTLYGVMGQVIRAAAGTTTYYSAIALQGGYRATAGRIWTAVGLKVIKGDVADAGTINEGYGIHVGASLGVTPGVYDVGIKLDAQQTAAVWFNTDTAAYGRLVWGASRDANLYRGAADVLYSDDSLRLAGHVRIGATAAPTNVTAGDLNAIRGFFGADAAMAAGATLHAAGHTRISGNLAVGGTATIDSRKGIVCQLTTGDCTLAATGAGARIAPVVNSTTQCYGYGVVGEIEWTGSGNASYILGLGFNAIANGTGTLSWLHGVQANLLSYAGAGVINTSHGFEVVLDYQGPKPGTFRGLYIHGHAGMTTVYGVRVEDFTGTTIRLLELGGAVPYLRVVGGAAPAASCTNLYLAEGVTPTLRQVRWMDPGAGGANFVGGERVLVLV